MSTATKPKPTTAKKPAAKKAAPTIDTVTVPASVFGTAWTWVERAMSTDTTRGMLSSMRLEVFSDTSVRLVATNSYDLLWCWVGGDDVPAVEAVPVAGVNVTRHPRAKSFFGFAAKGSPADDLTITIGDPTVKFATPWESLTLVRTALTRGDGEPVEYPDWQKLVVGMEAKKGTTGTILIDKPRLAILSLPGIKDHKGTAEMTFTGIGVANDASLGGVLLDWPAVQPPIRGVVMPMRTSSRR